MAFHLLKLSVMRSRINNMKLERITIEGTPYYQWVILGTEYPFINTVGSIFSDWRDIQREQELLKEKYNSK